MSNSTCIRHPGTRYIQIHEWQIKFCNDNHCAALLLAFFIAWHDWKIQNDHYYRRVNDIAEMHGDGRPHNQNAYLFFSMEELIDGCMGFYGKNTINEALQLLASLGVITIHKNPNPRYHFDKTKYFQFYPAVCNSWITENYPIENQKHSVEAQLVDYKDTPKEADRFTENKQRSAEIGRPSHEIGKAITDTTNNTTNKDQSINVRGYVDENSKQNKTNIKPIIDSLTAKGFPAKHFNYPDIVETIQHLCEAGATVEVFLAAYQKALSTTQTNGFGVNYLTKVVEGILKKKSSAVSSNPLSPTTVKTRIFENEIPDDLDWVNGDI